MINILLNDPIELNDKALRVMSTFKDWNRYAYTVTKFWEFERSNITFKELNEVKEKALTELDQIETDFKDIVLSNLSVLGIKSIEEASEIDPQFLIDYRTRRDVSDLVITSICLADLRNRYYAYTSFHVTEDETSPFKDFWPSFGKAKDGYEECVDFMQSFSPEALRFHRLTRGNLND